jgi:hypothetical protein
MHDLQRSPPRALLPPRLPRPNGDFHRYVPERVAVDQTVNAHELDSFTTPSRSGIDGHGPSFFL